MWNLWYATAVICKQPGNLYMNGRKKDKLSARHLEEGAAMNLLYTNSVIFL